MSDIDFFEQIDRAVGKMMQPEVKKPATKQAQGKTAPRAKASPIAKKSSKLATATPKKPVSKKPVVLNRAARWPNSGRMISDVRPVTRAQHTQAVRPAAQPTSPSKRAAQSGPVVDMMMRTGAKSRPVTQRSSGVKLDSTPKVRSLNQQQPQVKPKQAAYLSQSGRELPQRTIGTDRLRRRHRLYNQTPARAASSVGAPVASSVVSTTQTSSHQQFKTKNVQGEYSSQTVTLPNAVGGQTTYHHSNLAYIEHLEDGEKAEAANAVGKVSSLDTAPERNLRSIDGVSRIESAQPVAQNSTSPKKPVRSVSTEAKLSTQKSTQTKPPVEEVKPASPFVEEVKVAKRPLGTPPPRVEAELDRSSQLNLTGDEKPKDQIAPLYRPGMSELADSDSSHGVGFWISVTIIILGLLAIAGLVAAYYLKLF